MPSVFPAVSPRMPREVDAGGLVCWGAQMKTAPEGAGNTDEGLPNPKQPEMTTPMVDQNVPQFPKRWNIVAPFEGMTIGDLRLIVRLTADKPDDEPLAYSFGSDLDQLIGIQVV